MTDGQLRSIFQGLGFTLQVPEDSARQSQYLQWAPLTPEKGAADPTRGTAELYIGHCSGHPHPLQ